MLKHVLQTSPSRTNSPNKQNAKPHSNEQFTSQFKHPSNCKQHNHNYNAQDNINRNTFLPYFDGPIQSKPPLQAHQPLNSTPTLPTCSCHSLTTKPLRSIHITSCPFSGTSNSGSAHSTNSTHSSQATHSSHSSSSSSLASINQNTHCSASFRRSRYAQDRVNKLTEKGSRRGRPPDNISLDSSMSCSSSSNQEERISSNSSTGSVDNSKATVRVWVRCLLQEMEYKTVCISYSTTCRELVNNLLSKFRMKHRDPNLFYLAMEVTLRKAETEVRTCLRLEDDSFPAQLLACHPQEDSRLALRMRRGGLLRVYDGALSQGSNYKSLLVSDKTPCKDVVALVLACNRVNQDPQNFTLYEICDENKIERALLPTEQPMLVANQWHTNWKSRLEIRRLSPKEKQPFASFQLQHSQRTTNVTQIQNAKIQNCANVPVNMQNSSNLNVKSVEHYSNSSFSSSMDFDHSSHSESSFHCGQSSSPDSASSPLLMDTEDDPTLPIVAHTHKISIRSNYQNVPSGVENRPRRKLPVLPPDFVLMETVVDEEHPMTLHRRSSETPSPSKQFKTYNDYENYFYI